MTEQEFRQRCIPIENIFLTGIPEIDNDPKLKAQRERIFRQNNKVKKLKSIYIVKFKDGIIKIGVSKNPEKRIKTIERNSGRVAIESFISIEIENSFEIEAKIKEKFKGNNIKGEFYNQNYNEIVDFAKEMLRRRGIK